MDDMDGRAATSHRARVTKAQGGKLRPPEPWSVGSPASQTSVVRRPGAQDLSPRMLELQHLGPPFVIIDRVSAHPRLV